MKTIQSNELYDHFDGIDMMYLTDKSMQDLFKPAGEDCTAQAQEFLCSILTNVLDASAELDKEHPNWFFITVCVNNIKNINQKILEL